MISGLTLALDGSTYSGSVALLNGSELIAERQLPMAQKPGREGRAEKFLPMVGECLAERDVRPSQLARVVCGEGPGSFTSLRIAASIAKGIAVGAGIPLFSVSSLLLIIAGAERADGLWMSTLPAMRGEVFVASHEVSGGIIRSTGAPRIVAESQLDDEAARVGAMLAGPPRNETEIPHARGVARMLEQIIAAGARDVDTWEPIYGRLAEAQAKWEAAHGRPLVPAR